MVGLGRQGNGERVGGAGSVAPRRVLWVLPAVLIVLGLVFDLLTPPSFTGSPFFSAAPLVAAPLFPLLSTVLTGALASLTVVLLHLYNSTFLKAESLTELATVLTVSGLAILINRVVRRSGARLASARGIAEAAQRAVLPTPAERIGGLYVSARYEAAQADAFIGGDLYAVQDTPFGPVTWRCWPRASRPCRWAWGSWGPGRTERRSGLSRRAPRCCCTRTG